MLVAPSRGGGSGVLVGSDGYIVTNAHVVEGAHQIQVQLPTASGRAGRLVLHAAAPPAARVIAIDEETDLAVIKVDAKGLPALPSPIPRRAARAARARVRQPDGARTAR